MNHIYTGLDIGNSEIKIVVVNATKDACYLLTATSYRTEGLKKNVIYDEKKLKQSLLNAIKLTEEKIGMKIREVILTLPANRANMTMENGLVNIKDEVGTVAVQELKLQDGTPLIVVLARHLGFQGQTVQRLLQIAVADPEGNNTLDAYWEGLRRQVEYGMISDALIGYGGQTKNIVMQINNTFIPMEDFFSYIVNGLSLTGDGQINIHASGFPDRSVFTSLNKWNTTTTAAPNTYSGIIRSNKLYPQALGVLYDTKITIKLRQFMISDLAGVVF